MKSQFLVGAVCVELSPASGLSMDGYMARVGGSIGTHDPLTVTVLILEFDGQRAVIVTLDVMAVSRSFSDEVRRSLAELLETSPEAILICASHTHAGPSGLQDWSPIGSAALNHELVASVRSSILQGAEQASNRLLPMRLYSAVGEVMGIGGDRNQSERMIDNQVTLFAFEDMDNEAKIFLYHYACHPTVLSAENREYSADFPGAVRRRICEQYPNAICLFVNGAAANISTRFNRLGQTFDEVERLGHLLGDRILELVSEAELIPPTLNWISDFLALPLRKFSDKTRQIQSSGNARIDTVRGQGTAIEAHLRKALEGRESQLAIIGGLQIGNWYLLTVPGEAFNDLARALQQMSSRALVVGYTNDYLGYFPTQEAIDEATYEALSSPFDVKAHNLLQDGLIDLIGHLQSK